MKPKTLILLIFIALLISVGLTTIFFSLVYIEDTKVVPMDIEVGDRIGLNLDADAMHFGMSSPGGEARRGLIVQHQSSIPLKVDIRMYGEMASWIEVEENEFVLNPNQTKEVYLTVHIPQGTSLGSYNGTIVIFFKRVDLILG